MLSRIEGYDASGIYDEDGTKIVEIRLDNNGRISETTLLDDDDSVISYE